MEVDDKNMPAEVVFIVEATASLGAYIDVLKTNYIIPTLEHFCGYSLSEHRRARVGCSDTLFALVAYHTANSAPEPASICIGPTSSAQKLLLWIETMQFVGDGAENLGHVTEGLASALQIFDDFQQIHEPNNNDTCSKSNFIGKSQNNALNNINNNNNISKQTIAVDATASANATTKNNGNINNVTNSNAISGVDTVVDGKVINNNINNNNKDSNNTIDGDSDNKRNVNCDNGNLSSKQKSSELDSITEITATTNRTSDEIKSMSSPQILEASTEATPTGLIEATVVPLANGRKRHCILICNSAPYQKPCIESPSYFGVSLDHIVSSMRERHISLSIITPRKMSFLFKLFEKAGGDLQSAMSKQYARDARHLILLRNYQLQERPISPPSFTNPKSQLQVNQLPLHSQPPLSSLPPQQQIQQQPHIQPQMLQQPSHQLQQQQQHQSNQQQQQHFQQQQQVMSPQSPMIHQHKQMPSPVTTNNSQKRPHSPVAATPPQQQPTYSVPSPMIQQLKQMPSPITANQKPPQSPAAATPPQQPYSVPSPMIQQHKQMPSPITANHKLPQSPAAATPPQLNYSAPSPLAAATPPQSQQQQQQQQAYSAASPMAPMAQQIAMRQQPQQMTSHQVAPQQIYHNKQGSNVMLIPNKDDIVSGSFDSVKRQLEVPISQQQKQKVGMFKPTLEQTIHKSDQNQINFTGGPPHHPQSQQITTNHQAPANHQQPQQMQHPQQQQQTIQQITPHFTIISTQPDQMNQGTHSIMQPNIGQPAAIQTIQVTTSQTPPQAKNPLLNASLGPITNNQQPAKTVNFTPNMLQQQQQQQQQIPINVVTSNVPTSVLGQTLQSSRTSGNMIVNAPVVVGPQQHTHTNHQLKHTIQGPTQVIVSDSPIGVTQTISTGAPTMQQQLAGTIVGNNPPQQTATMTIGSGQVITNAQIVGTQPSNVVGQVIQQRPIITGAGVPVVQNRQQNLQNIQKLENDLQEAKRREALFQQQAQHHPDLHPAGPQQQQVGIGPNSQTGHTLSHHSHQQQQQQGPPMQIIRQPMNQGSITANHQGGPMLQQRQMAQQQQRITIQQQQHPQQQVIIQQQGRQVNLNVTPNNTQALRNILQQQSHTGVITRTVGPPQSNQGGSIGPMRHVRPIIHSQTIQHQQQPGPPQQQHPGMQQHHPGLQQQQHAQQQQQTVLIQHPHSVQQQTLQQQQMHQQQMQQQQQQLHPGAPWN